MTDLNTAASVANTVAATPVVETQTVAQVFGLNPSDLRDRPHNVRSDIAEWAKPYIPAVKSHFFDKETYNDLTEYHRSGFKDGGLFITGPKGSGKSKSVEQYYARLGTPIFAVNCHGSLELFELIGSMAIKGGDTEFQYGPLTLAVMCGGVLMVDEIDAAPPELLIALHGVLEMGDRLILPENGGQVIPVHPAFRIVVTGNTNGSGDFSGEYAGTNMQNSATLDRFNFLEWNYLSLENEKKIVLAEVPNMDLNVLDGMLKIAAESRLGEIEAISTRSLIRWVRKSVAFKGQPIKKSFDRSIGFRLDPAKRNEVYSLVVVHLGSIAFFGKEAVENNA